MTQQNWFGFFYNFFWCFRQLYWNFFPRHFTLLYYLDSNHWSIQFSNKQSIYRKVASSRPVYYSIFDYFWGATNQDVLLTETCYYCYVQKSMKCWVHKRLHEFSSIFVDLPWLALFLKTPFKNVLKSFDRALLLSCKCIFISKIWKNSWGSYILVEKVDDFGISYALIIWLISGHSNSNTSRLVARLG